VECAGKTDMLTEQPVSQADVYRIVRRREENAGIGTKIGCHSFRATGMTTYLKNGGSLEIAQEIAQHESSRTTGLYDRRDDDVSLDEWRKS
jgi:integrase